MPNFEFKKDRVCEPAPNLALDSIVNGGRRLYLDGRISSYGIFGSLGKAPAARKSKERNLDIMD